MPENDRLDGCLNEVELGFVEREAIPKLLMKLGIRLCSFGTRRSILWISDAPAKVVDGGFQQHFAEL